MDTAFLVRVAKFAEGLLERELVVHEKKQLISFVKQNIEFVKHKRDVVQIAELANEYVNLLEGADNLEGMDNMDDPDNEKKYINDKNLNLVSFLGIDNLDRLISEFNPPAKRKRAYMCLDSRYARFNNDCTKLTWAFTNNLNDVNNATNVVGPVRDITWIRMQSIVVRKFSSIPQRATILIEELSAQSFIMPSGRKFHFVGLLNDLQNPLDIALRNTIVIETAVPDITIYDKYELLAGYKFNDGYYRFNDPITTLNEITVSIGNPDTLVVIPKYEFTNVSVADVQNNYIDFEFNEPHNYVNHLTDVFLNEYGVYSVFIDGFSSSDANFNDYLNNKEHTYMTITSPTQLRIFYADMPAGSYNPFPPPLGLLVAPPAPWTVQRIRFNSHRIIMNFELEYISQS